MTNWLFLIFGGLFAGFMAGFLGVGGGTVLVPMQIALGYAPVQAVATSSLAIVITATSGTIQNWRMGFINFQRVILLGLPAVFTTQIGVYLANIFSSKVLLITFGLLLLLNILLVAWRKRLILTETDAYNQQPTVDPNIARIITGGAAGILAGLFGVGGGIIMVPLQMVLLKEPIKVAIQTSLGVIVIISISASVGHALRGNILFAEGLILGFGGLLGAQVSTRFLPKLPDKTVSITFRILLAILSAYMFWKAWHS
ncbi:MAG: sulfite exporter TauE/SafE family protein [Calothrix sp. MO_192.B10]|nr:sulfite exporter TauE/SafE family protein [Calothrix sp. MO_192.B10]